MHAKQALIFCSIALICVACTKPAPQLPANKIRNIDSLGMALTEVNNTLISYEDSVLTQYVNDSCPGMIKSGQGFWYKITKSEKVIRLKQDDECSFNASIFTLDGQLKIKNGYKVVVAKNQVFKGLDDGLRLLGRGEEAEFIFPWYLAYGVRGNGNEIPAYTSIKVLVKMK